VVWKRAAEIALLCCVAVWPAALEGDTMPQKRVSARALSYPYDEGALFAMPGEKVLLSVGAGNAAAQHRRAIRRPCRNGPEQVELGSTSQVGRLHAEG
jgi:hypothetical protein